jgi:tetratricopeptide (TPR) repeat protein
MEKISLCMIVKDEAENIRRCLESVRSIVNEMIVVDTGSSDGTAAIAAQTGAKVYRYSWNDDFSAARNYSLKQACGDWILCLDADEELLACKQDLDPILTDSSVEGYFLKILNYLGDENDEICPDLVFRLFRNRNEYRFHGVIHEQILDTIRPNRNCFRIVENIIINHYGYLNRQVALKDKKNRNLQLLIRELKRDPGNRLARYFYGEELYHSGRYHEALTELIKAADGIETASIILPKLFRYLIAAYYGLRQYEAALKIIDQGLSYFPDYPDLYYLTGLIYYEQKRFNPADKAFQTALSMPEPPVHYASASGIRGFRTYYQLGRLAEIHCKTGEALDYYTRCFSENSNFTPALNCIIRILTPEQDPRHCLAYLERNGIMEKPGIHIQLAEACFENSFYDFALQYYESVDCNEIPATVHLRKAVCLIQQHHFRRALTLLDQIPESEAEYPTAVFNKLFCAVLLRDPLLFSTLSKTVKPTDLTPDSLKIIDLLANLIVPAGSGTTTLVPLEDEGITLFLQLLKRLVHLGELQMADSLLRDLAAPFPPRHCLTCGNIYFHYGHWDIAESLYRRILNDSPDPGEIYYRLAKVKAARENFLEAADYYRFALGYTLREPGYFIALSDTYQRLSRQAINDALRLFLEDQKLRHFFREGDREINAALGKNLDRQFQPPGNGPAASAQPPSIRQRDATSKERHVQNGLMLKQYQNAVKREPANPQFHYNLAMAWYELGRYQRASVHFNQVMQASEIQPTLRTAAIRYFIKCRKQLNQEAEAIGICLKETKRYPDYADLFFDGALLFEGKNEYRLAAKWFGKALDCGPPPAPLHHTSGTESFFSLYHLGYCHEQLQQYQTARDDYEKALSVNPDFDLALRRLFTMILAEKGPAATLQYFLGRTYLKNPEHLCILAQQFFDAGYYHLAYTCFEQTSLDRNPTIGEYAETERLICQIYAGNPQKAIDSWKRLYPDIRAASSGLAYEIAIAGVIGADFATSQAIVRELWLRHGSRNLAWAAQILSDYAQNGKIRSRPEKSREPEVIQHLITLMERCWRYLPDSPADQAATHQNLAKLLANGFACLSRLSLDSALALIQYLRKRANQIEKLFEHSALL